MAKRKRYYYVLVITNEGPKFVTRVDYLNKEARWNENDKPLNMAKDMAEDLAMGLCANMHMAFAVSNFYELDSQPYLYRSGHFEWKWDSADEIAKKGDDEEDDRK